MRVPKKQLYKDAWLGLTEKDYKNILNPLDDISKYEWQKPHLAMLRFMRNPKNVWFTAKHLFGVQLFPFQSLILQELWTKPFPMFIASRGAGKSWLLALHAMLKCLLFPGSKIVIIGAAFRQSKVIFDYMETLWKNAPIVRSVCGGKVSGPRKAVDKLTMHINDSWATAIPLGDGSKIRGLRAHTILTDEFNCLRENSLIETNLGLVRIKESFDKQNVFVNNKNGAWEKPEHFIQTPLCDAYEVKTKYGYSFVCSANHKVLTLDGWKKPVELSTDDKLLFDNKYRFPTEYIEYNDFVVDEKWAYIFGWLISEGSITNKNSIGITNTDKKVIDRLERIFIELGYSPKIYHSKSYTDSRGWKCKECWRIHVHSTELRKVLKNLGLDYVTSHNKDIPWSILQSPKSVVCSFLAGLFEGDGSCFNFKYNKTKYLGIAYYTVSENLAHDVHILLKKLDILSLRQTRKSAISNNKQWMIRLNGEYCETLIQLLKIKSWEKKLSSSHICRRKEDYGIVWLKDKKKWRVNILGEYLGAFKTKKEARIVRDQHLKDTPDALQVSSVTLLDNKEVLYDYHLPITHSFYGNGFVQHNSVPTHIYETVVAGFTASSSNPVQNAMEDAAREAMKKDGVWTEHHQELYETRKTNQSILSGTAGYDFEHFAEYFKQYRAIIRSKGDINYLQRLFGADYEVPENFSWKDYSIVRLPYELVPSGMMDDKQISRAKATMHIGTYSCEYAAVFAKDSNGFFKRSIIKACTTSENNPVVLPDGPVWFYAKTAGDRNQQYVMGIDPAAVEDNFTIVILELHHNHNRVVYGWSTNMKDFKARQKAGLTKLEGYYAFCARKIRDLMRVFNIAHIAMDSQGGGLMVYEALNDSKQMNEGENFIWEVIDEDKEKDTDHKAGLHILELVSFADAKWTSDANNGLRKDMEDKILLFPEINPIEMGLAIERDKALYGDKYMEVYDSHEDCLVEIQELKDELCTITMSQTPSGRDKWDTPEIKLENGKKGRLRKDRYSALLMGNMAARQIARAAPPPRFTDVGRLVGTYDKHKFENRDQANYGPEWARYTLDVCQSVKR